VSTCPLTSGNLKTTFLFVSNQLKEESDVLCVGSSGRDGFGLVSVSVSERGE
jgi:hypothetical protein